MKILIIGFTKLKYMPYMNLYLDNIDKNKNDVHILYWNRDLKDEDTKKFNNITLKEFKCYQEDDVSKIKKISSFIKYRKFAKNVLKTENYDFIIVLHSLTGILIYDKLKRYNNRFIFDYRDSTYEKVNLFRRKVCNLVKYSKVTFVSSDGFRVFFPKNYQSKIYTSHNILMDSLKNREQYKIKTKSEKIRISFWGFIRHEEINKEIIKKISNDNRFELHYYGREQQVAISLKEYANKINATNVFFHGEYRPNDRYEFAKNTDIIHNIYDDSNTKLSMGNKFYDGIIFYLPQLCMEDTFMAKQVKNKNIGLVINPYDAYFTERIYSYFKKIDIEEFIINCNKETIRVIREYNFDIEIIRKMLGENGNELQ